MKSTFIPRVVTTIGLLLGAFALSALAATWTAPTAPAPGGNPDAPINVGNLLQNKLGWLGVKGLVTTDFTLATGTSPRAGKVLTAIDDLGNATWATPSGGGASNWETGEITIPCQAYAWPSSQNVTFTKTFGTAPKIITQPKWERYTGNESAAWWVTNVTTTGFTMNYGTPNSGSCYPSSGGNGIMWVAVGQGTGDPSGGGVTVTSDFVLNTHALDTESVNMGVHKACFLKSVYGYDTDSGYIACYISTSTNPVNSQVLNKYRAICRAACID